MSRDYDAIIIGSGLGGLSCGAYLAKNNWKTLVIEKHSKPGGYATSFKRDNYTFNVGLHMIDGVGKGQSLAKSYELCGVADSIEFIKLKYFMRLVFPEHDIHIPSGDLEAVITILEKNFPYEKEGIRSLFKEMVRIYRDVIRFLFSSAPMWQQLPIFPFRYRALFPTMKKTVSQLLDKHLNDYRLKSLLFANYGFFGLPPRRQDSPLLRNGMIGSLHLFSWGKYQ